MSGKCDLVLSVFGLKICFNCFELFVLYCCTFVFDKMIAGFYKRSLKIQKHVKFFNFYRGDPQKNSQTLKRRYQIVCYSRRNYFTVKGYKNLHHTIISVYNLNGDHIQKYFMTVSMISAQLINFFFSFTVNRPLVYNYV